MTTINVQVSANEDDAREAAGVVGLANEGAVDAVDEYFGMRWTGITIPAGAIITTAWIDMWIIDDLNDEPDHTIYFEDNATPAVFTTGASDISNRTPTTATATLSSADLGASASGDWLSDLETMPFPELKTIIQELVDSYDYSSGGAMAAIIRGSADAGRDLRRGDYSSDTTKAAKLHIEYTLPVAKPMFQKHTPFIWRR